MVPDILKSYMSGDAAARMAVNSSNATQKIPVSFSIPSSAQYLTCKTLKIEVQSMRWPATRVSAASSSATAWNQNAAAAQANLQHVAQQVQADAAIYVMPQCPYSAVPDPACVPGFTGFSCYPYCIGVHLTGSVNQGIVLYGANDWRDSVQYILRDCGVAQSSSGAQLSVPQLSVAQDAAATAAAAARYSVTGAVVFGAASQSSWDPATQSCVSSATVDSRMAAGVTGVFQFPTDVSAPTIREKFQPFAFAGDVVLTAYDDGSGGWLVKVSRIFGEDLVTFQLVDLPGLIPANDVCLGSAECSGAPQPGRLGVPYAYQDYPQLYNPATVSQWAVLYATNPNPEVYQ
eukprot:675088-Hanusia_phi.AAC.1